MNERGLYVEGRTVFIDGIVGRSQFIDAEIVVLPGAAFIGCAFDWCQFYDEELEPICVTETPSKYCIFSGKTSPAPVESVPEAKS